MAPSLLPAGSRRRWAPYYLLLPSLILLVVFFLLPLGSLFLTSLHQYVPGLGVVPDWSLANYFKFMSDFFYSGVMLTTMAFGLIVTLICLILGYPAAFFLARTTSRRKGLFLALIIFPLFLNIVVRSFAWIVILSNRGLVNNFLVQVGLLETPVKLLFTPFSVVVGMTHVLLPFMVLAVASTIQGVDRDYEEAARSLGANRFQTFVRITLPLSLPGVIAGCLLVFLLTITAFVTPRLLGGVSVQVISNLIYQQFMFVGNWPFGAALSFILLLATLVIIGVYFRVFMSAGSQAARPERGGA